MQGIPGTAASIFSTLRDNNINVIMISQASSEHSLCFAVRAADAPRAQRFLRTKFADAIRSGLVTDVEVIPDCAVLAAVGQRMASNRGIAAKVFDALARAGVNVKAMAQGSSEYNITILVDEAAVTRGLRAVHSRFFCRCASPQGHTAACFMDYSLPCKHPLSRFFCRCASPQGHTAACVMIKCLRCKRPLSRFFCMCSSLAAAPQEPAVACISSNLFVASAPFVACAPFLPSAPLVVSTPFVARAPSRRCRCHRRPPAAGTRKTVHLRFLLAMIGALASLACTKPLVALDATATRCAARRRSTSP